MSDYRVVTSSGRLECLVGSEPVIKVQAHTETFPDDGVTVHITLHSGGGERFVMTLAHANGRTAIELSEAVLEAMFKATPIGDTDPSRVVVVP